MKFGLLEKNLLVCGHMLKSFTFFLTLSAFKIQCYCNVAQLSGMGMAAQGSGLPISQAPWGVEYVALGRHEVA